MRLRRRVPGHAYCKEKLTLTRYVDTAAPNINLSPVRTVDISEKIVFSHGRIMNADRPTFRPASTQPTFASHRLVAVCHAAAGHAEAAKMVWAFLQQKDPAQRSREPIKLSRLHPSLSMSCSVLRDAAEHSRSGVCSVVCRTASPIR